MWHYKPLSYVATPSLKGDYSNGMRRWLTELSNDRASSAPEKWTGRRQTKKSSTALSFICFILCPDVRLHQLPCYTVARDGMQRGGVGPSRLSAPFPSYILYPRVNTNKRPRIHIQTESADRTKASMQMTNTGSRERHTEERKLLGKWAEWIYS